MTAPMWICAYSVQKRRDVLEDFWSVHETEAEARDALAKAEAEHDLYCFAVGPIRYGSEPQYEGM